MNRREVLAGLGVLSATGLAGCSNSVPLSNGSTDDTTRELTDGFGRTVAVPETVERVVGVGPGSLRQLAYLESTDLVVGTEDENEPAQRAPYNLANPDLDETPIIGDGGPNAGGNTERILAVDPDLICYYGEPSRAATLQSQTETPVVGLEIVDFADHTARETVFETWRLLGDVLSKDSRAETVIEFVKEVIADLKERTADPAASEGDRAYVGAINHEGAHGLRTTRPEFAPFQWTDVSNVASDVDTNADSVQVSTEQLLAWNPERMFLSGANLSRVREDVNSNPEYESLAAVEAGETYAILPHASYHTNYGSVLANAYFVGTRVYPDRFADVSVQSKTETIFETMLGEPLYDALVEEYSAFEQLELP